MINRMKEFIMKDLGWKLLSVAIAIVLWFIVINIENPPESRSYSVPITFENIDAVNDAGYVVTNIDEYAGANVTVRVRAQRLALDRLSQNRHNITAVVDLSKTVASSTVSASQAVSVDIKLPSALGSSYDIISRSRTYVELDIERAISKSIRVNTYTEGSVREGSIVSSTSVSPVSVVVTGAESAVEKVASVSASVSIDSAEHSFESEAVPTAYDEAGNAVTGVSINPDEVRINVSVNRIKNISLRADTVGEPMDGYLVSRIRVTPESIEAVGSAEALDGLSQIELPLVDISGRYSTVTEVYDIRDYLPQGVSLRNSSMTNVSVNVDISAESIETRTFDLQSAALAIVGSPAAGTTAEVRRETLRVAVSGTTENLNRLEGSTIAGSLDINGLAEGSHRVSVDITLPSGLRLSGTAPQATVIVTASGQAGNDGSQVPPEPEETPGESDETPPEDTPSSGGAEDGGVDVEAPEGGEVVVTQPETAAPVSRRNW